MLKFYFTYSKKGFKMKKYRSKLDAHKDEIAEYLKIGLSYIAITKLINRKLKKEITYHALRLFCIRTMPELVKVKKSKSFQHGSKNNKKKDM
jgi:hypothetical protein